ncbi:MAG: SPOR domain-containing protein [Kiloniellaceae bacterium]
MTTDPSPDRLRLIIEADEAAERLSLDRDGAPGGHDRSLRADESILDPESDYDEAEDESEEPRSRMVPMALALIALGAFVGVVWYAYDWGISGVGTEEVPVVRADARPIKTRPAVPGGREVANQESVVLNEIVPDPDKPQVERLLPPPEVPRPPPAPAATPAPNTTIKIPPQSSAAPPPAASGQAVAKPNGAPSSTSDLQIASGPEASAPPAKPVPKAAPPAKPAAKAAKPVKKAAPPQTAAVPATGGYMVQLSSLKDGATVAGEWARLQKAYPALLGGRTLDVQVANLGSRGVFHRVRAGVFASRAAAAALCGKLKAKKQDCFVVKR